MKKIFFVLYAVVILVSCSSDDGSDFHYELLPINEAEVPDVFEFGNIYTVKVKYNIPDNCYIESDVLYEYDEDARNIAVMSLVIEDDDCQPVAEEQELSFEIQALQETPYILRFWQGEDEEGDPKYLVVEVPVIKNIESADEFKTTHTKL